MEFFLIISTFLITILLYSAWVNANNKDANANEFENSNNTTSPIRIAVFILIATIIAITQFTNADYGIALFFAILVSVSTISVIGKADNNILKSNVIYNNSITKRNKKNKQNANALTYFARFIRFINLIIVSPIIGVAAGLLFRAYSPGIAVDLLVYMAFVASITYAFALAYFASTQKVFQSFIAAIAVIGGVYFLISKSPIFDMA